MKHPLRAWYIVGVTICLGVLLGAPGQAFGGPFRHLSILAGQAGGYGTRDGKGAVARFGYAFAGMGVADDLKGHLYVADSGSNTIRRVTISTGVVKTFAGVPSTTFFACNSVDGKASAARFCAPSGIVYAGNIGSAGTLYVADALGSTIRAIDIAHKTVSTVAGSPGQNDDVDGVGSAARFFLTSTLNEPSFPALVYDGNANLYVSDTGNSSIRKVVVAQCSSGTPCGTVTTLTGKQFTYGCQDGTTSAATFTNPNGLAYDLLSGSLYVADWHCGSIRQIAGGQVTTLAGGGSAGSDGTGSAAGFLGPIGLVWDGSTGNLFVTDGGCRGFLCGAAVRLANVNSAAVSTIAGSTVGEGDADGTGSAAAFNFPVGITTDDTGNLYLLDEGNATLRKVTTGGVVTTLAGAPPSSGSTDGPESAARFCGVDGVAYVSYWDRLYVVDGCYGTIRSIDDAGNTTTVFNNGVGNGVFGGLAADNAASDVLAGDLFAIQNCNVVAINPADGAILLLAGNGCNFTLTDGTGSSASFLNPNGLAYDGAGNLYVTDGGTAVRKLHNITCSIGNGCSAAVTTIAGSTTAGSADGVARGAQFQGLQGIAYDGSANLYVVDGCGNFGCNNTIRKISIATENVTTLAGTAGVTGSKNGVGPAASFNGPGGIAMAADGAHLFVADSSNSTLREITIATSRVKTIIGKAGQTGVVARPLGSPVAISAAAAGLNYPQGLALIPSGSQSFPTGALIISDSGENVILEAH